MMGRHFWGAIATIAYKEFIHVWRDRGVLLAILIVPPFFTLVFGHAFQETALRDVPTLLYDADKSSDSQKFVDLVRSNGTFVWKAWDGPGKNGQTSLLRTGAKAAIIIPKGWGKGLHDGDPKPIHVVLDGSDTDTAPSIQGVLQEILGDFQMKSRDNMIDTLPDEVFEMGEKLPESVRHEFGSAMTPWTMESKILYNPGLRFIDFLIPGIIGLILQLLTVTLIASTIAREREVGTLSQLLVTPLRQSEIVIGKVVPYLIISLFLIAGTIMLSHFHFGVKFRQPIALGLICFLFLLCSLSLGLLISAVSKTQTQAIQFSVFVLLPVLLLSGAFTSIEHLPDTVRLFSQLFPLTHFCHAFRLVNMYNAGGSFIAVDLVCLAAGAALTCAAAAYLLRSADQ
ncbi:MAG: ABC transporter permease [Chthoniobacterales bacterium]